MATMVTNLMITAVVWPLEFELNNILTVLDASSFSVMSRSRVCKIYVQNYGSVDLDRVNTFCRVKREMPRRHWQGGGSNNSREHTTLQRVLDVDVRDS